MSAYSDARRAEREGRDEDRRDDDLSGMDRGRQRYRARRNRRVDADGAEASAVERGRQLSRDRRGTDTARTVTAQSDDLSGMERGRQLSQARRAGDTGRGAHRTSERDRARPVDRAGADRTSGDEPTDTEDVDEDDAVHVHNGGRRRGTARGGASMGQGRNPQTGGDAGTGVQAGRDRWSRSRDPDAPRESQRGRDPREQRAHRKRIDQQVTRSRQNRAARSTTE